MIRRSLTLAAALVVIAIGLAGESCAAATTVQQTATPTDTVRATPTFGITFNGKIFQCSQGNCPADLTWDGQRTIASPPHAAVLTADRISTDPNYTDTVTFEAIIGAFRQNPTNPGKVAVTTGSIFYVHTSGLPSATTPPALGAGYYSAVQVYKESTDATGVSTMLLYFVTFNFNGQQKAGGAALIQVPQHSAHITVNLVTGGSLSVLDGSSSGTSTPTATP